MDDICYICSIFSLEGSGERSYVMYLEDIRMRELFDFVIYKF